MFAIDEILQLNLIPSDFTVYADRNKSSLIVSFAAQSHKRMLMNALQQRKSLLAEENFPSIESNSNIYANDQLTSYFASIFQAAWKAKKEGLIFSASSLGGKIKVKRFENSPATVVDTHQQLNNLLKCDRSDGAQNQSNGTPDTRNDNNGTSSSNNQH